MKKLIALLLIIPFIASSQQKTDILRWQETAKRVNIIRDKWGIPHVYGKSDADCVFGLMYAQCEDDFQRVEMNYITMLGRTSEVNGEADIYEDLLVRMVIDSAESVNDYNVSPDWMKKLLNAFADGNHGIHSLILMEASQPYKQATSLRTILKNSIRDCQLTWQN